MPTATTATATATTATATSATATTKLTSPPARLFAEAQRSLEELVTNAMPLVRWLAWQKYHAQDATRAAVDHEDLAQEILLRAVKRFHQFDPVRSKFSTWLSLLARDVAHDVRQRVLEIQGNTKTVSGTVKGEDGSERDRLAMLTDPKAVDPAAGVALVRVLVPVCELTRGACPLAFVRDIRTGQCVQVPASDVVTYHGKLFAVAVSFDEDGEGYHRVRFGNDAVCWALAAVNE